MAMTKEEILKAIRNHGGEIKTAVAVLDYHVYALTHGYRTLIDGEMNSLKDMMRFIETKANEIKDILDQWPS